MTRRFLLEDYALASDIQDKSDPLESLLGTLNMASQETQRNLQQIKFSLRIITNKTHFFILFILEKKTCWSFLFFQLFRFVRDIRIDYYILNIIIPIKSEMLPVGIFPSTEPPLAGDYGVI